MNESDIKEMFDDLKKANRSADIKVEPPSEFSSLLPCPFCGLDAEVRYEDRLGGFIAGCTNNLCAIGGAGRLSGDKAKTIAFWNSRSK